MKIKDAIEHLKQYNEEGHCCMVLWLPEDVRMVADDKGIEVTDADIAGTLAFMENNHDATLGITWETIEYVLENK